MSGTDVNTANNNAVTQDLTVTCFSCNTLDMYTELTRSFADNLSTALHDPMLIMYSSLTGLWFALFGYKLLFKLSDIGEFVKEFMYLCVTGLLLSAHATGLVSWVYSVSLDIIGAACDAAWAVAMGPDKSTGFNGLTHLAASGEKAIAVVFFAAKAIIKSGGWANIANYIYAFILVAPYFLMIVFYASQIVVAIFRLMIVACFSPWLFLGFGFGWGRPMMSGGARTIVGAIGVMFACTAALALIIFAVNGIVGINGIGINDALSGEKLNDFASLSNPDFLAILFLGWMGTGLMTEGVSIANSILGTMLTNTAAATMTAGVSASALMGAKAAGSVNPFSGKSMGNLMNAAKDFAASPGAQASAWMGGKALGAGASYVRQGMQAHSLYRQYFDVNRSS